MARHRLPAKLRALGDSATNGAFALLKPQFSPTRNAPLEGHRGVAVPFPATLPKRSISRTILPAARAICPVLDTVEATCTQTGARYPTEAPIRREAHLD